MSLKIPDGMALPDTLDDIDAEFLTALLRARGVISESNSITATEERGVGMTAGFFSAIKRVGCTYAEPTDAMPSFVVKAWPQFELAPRETIAGMFQKDLKGYAFETTTFYPQPRAYLADCDASNDRWGLVMDDANVFAEQKLHENEMSEDEVMRMVPRLVDIAVYWEGCHEGERGTVLDTQGVPHWASDENLETYLEVMPNGAPFWDYLVDSGTSDLTDRNWGEEIGSCFPSLFTRKLQAFYESVRPENGATCTLSHGDLRGDNLFFCDPSPTYPDGWLAIDFQLMFRGPVPSDLAYLMTSGTVLPEVYAGAARDRIMRAFYDQFMQKTVRYRDYTWDQFVTEYGVMSTVLFVYYVGFGANIMIAGLSDEQPVRIEFGTKGETEADLPPEQLRQRMWWRNTVANFATTFSDLGLYDRVKALPDNTLRMAQFFDIPAKFKV